MTSISDIPRSVCMYSSVRFLCRKNNGFTTPGKTKPKKMRCNRKKFRGILQIHIRFSCCAEKNYLPEKKVWSEKIEGAKKYRHHRSLTIRKLTDIKTGHRYCI